jgi:hypothetical protein
MWCKQVSNNNNRCPLVQHFSSWVVDLQVSLQRHEVSVIVCSTYKVSLVRDVCLLDCVACSVGVTWAVTLPYVVTAGVQRVTPSAMHGVCWRHLQIVRNWLYCTLPARFLVLPPRQYNSGPYSLLTTLSPLRPGLDPRLVRVRFVVEKVALDRLFSWYFGCPMSVSLLQCSMLSHAYTFLLPES